MGNLFIIFRTRSQKFLNTLMRYNHTQSGNCKSTGTGAGSIPHWSWRTIYTCHVRRRRYGRSGMVGPLFWPEKGQPDHFFRTNMLFLAGHFCSFPSRLFQAFEIQQIIVK